MSITNNPIIVIDDDEDDLELITDAYQALDFRNQLLAFSDPDSFLDFIYNTEKSPFFILCDLNIPKVTGLTLRDKLISDDRVRFKSIPFLIWSTSSNDMHIKQAYEKLIQGYFIKPSSFDELKVALKAIITYWSISQHPKGF